MKKLEKGVTLIELLAVSAIIIILTLVVATNYRSGQKQLSLERSAAKLAQDIRRAQEKAMAAEETGDDVPSGGYGVEFESQGDLFYYFITDNDPGEGIIKNRLETIELEPGVVIKSPQFMIIFESPEPEVYIDYNGDSSLATADITIGFEEDDREKIIEVNKAGLINVK